MNNATWVLLHSTDPIRIAAGHIDAGRPADLVVDFGSPYGMWTLRNGSTWKALHAFPVEAVVLVDQDGNGQDEVVVDFGPYWGLWQFANDSSWRELLPVSPVSMVGARRR
jgi:hypothetical protein